MLYKTYKPENFHSVSNPGKPLNYIYLCNDPSKNNSYEPRVVYDRLVKKKLINPRHIDFMHFGLEKLESAIPNTYSLKIRDILSGATLLYLIPMRPLCYVEPEPISYPYAVTGTLDFQQTLHWNNISWNTTNTGNYPIYQTYANIMQQHYTRPLQAIPLVDEAITQDRHAEIEPIDFNQEILDYARRTIRREE